MRIPQAINSAILRVQRDCFTDSDLRNILIHIREGLPVNSPLRELGHIIAHPKKDRGLTYEHALRAYVNGLYLHKYVINSETVFPSNGTCDWWLRYFLITQCEKFPFRELRSNLGIGGKKLIKEVKSYFPISQNKKDSEQFPTNLVKYPDDRFIKILNTLMPKIFSAIVFSQSQIERELCSNLKKFQIDLDRNETLKNKIIAGICVILHHTKVSFVDGKTGELRIIQEHSSNLNDQKILMKVCCYLPEDQNKKRFVFPFFETEVDADDFFLCNKNDHEEYSSFQYRTDDHLSFDASASPIIQSIRYKEQS